MKLATMLLVAATSGPAVAPPPDQLPFRQLADLYLRAHGLDAESLTAGEEVVGAVCDRVPLGLFEVYFPAGTLADSEAFEDLRDLCGALVDAERRWMLLLTPDKKTRPESILGALDDLETLGEAIARWRTKKAPEAEGGGGRDLLSLMSPDEDVMEAAARLDAFALAGGPLAPGRTEPLQVRLVLVPTRKTFVQLVCAAGRVDPYMEEAFWVEGLESFVQADMNGLRVIALEYFDGAGPVEYAKGVSMSARGPERQEQQIVQLALLHLFADSCGQRTDDAFDSALASDLVIDAYGEVETRTDGDTRARSADGRSMFVPGGNSNGGVLPTSVADGRWREDHGEDRFVRVLHGAQKGGARDIKERNLKHTGFLLFEDTGKVKLVVTAPFLGPDALTPTVPPALEGDWLEFQRSYRIAFVHWLRLHAAGKKQSPLRFAELLAALGTTEGEDLLALAPKLYDDRPLTDSELTDESLEGSFLHWLTKQ